jgi:alpha-ketoglutarate-dependent taurine dioxygenase
MIENLRNQQDQTSRNPLLITPSELSGGSRITDLADVINANLDDIRRDLAHFGAILFRGFAIHTKDDFRNIAGSIKEEAMPYTDGNSPRTKLTSNTYTSTEFPADQFISLHSELSYSNVWPARMLFCCVQPAMEGGETPLCDNATLLSHLPKEIVDEFSQKQLCYIRNLHAGYGLGPSWQKTFETEEKAEVEAFCKRTDSEFTWHTDDSITIKQYRPAVRMHPISQEKLWFNQADQFHISNFEPDVQEAIMALYGDDTSSRPQHVTFGDHTEIDAAYFSIIRSITHTVMVPVSWEAGDLVYLDNMKVMHGRMPYKGSRTVLLTMYK